MRERRRRVRTPGGVAGMALAVVLTAGLCGTVTAPASTAITKDWQTRMLEKVNWVRASAGAGPLHLCRALNRSARAYANQMARTGTFGHVAADGSRPEDRLLRAGYHATVAGENLGAGQRTVVEVTRQWRASPTHYAAMIDPRFTDVGFGYVTSPGSPYATYWVQHFGVGGRC